MRLHYPLSLAPQATALDEFDLGAKGNAALESLHRHGFSAYVDPTTELLGEIQAAATEPAVMEYCPNDQLRFTYENILTWLKKQRILPHIRTPDGRLAAYGWLGPEDNTVIPGANITTAYRATQAGTAAAREVRGSTAPDFRIGKILGEVVLGIGTSQLGLKPGDISLETWKSNHGARRLYDELGFVQKDEILDQKGRPTLHTVGEIIDGKPVFTDPKDADVRRVVDSRCYYVLENY